MDGEQNIALPGYVSFIIMSIESVISLFSPDKKHRGPSREDMMSLGVICALDQLVSGLERSGCLRRRKVVDMYIGLDRIG